jgi:hypothetical protein
MMNTQRIIYANIDLHETEFKFSLSPTKPDSATYSFLMHQKPIQFGDILINQMWMPKDSLYGKKNSPDHNRNALIELYWKCCELMSTKGDQGVLETYLLARLLPNIRQNACAKVFKDACLKPEKSRIKAAAFAAELDELIKQALNDPMTDAEFWTQTNDFLGPGDQCEEIKSLYQEMSNELFPLASEGVHLDKSVLFDGVLTRWNKWMLKIGRRRNNKDAKKVLDILSYEARCAIHRCYSWFWSVFTKYIAELNNYPNEFVMFHHLWHLAPVYEETEDGSRFYEFHGHVPGLHPAGGYFLQTPTGQQIVCNLLKNPTRRNHEYFLKAYLLSCIVYDGELTKSRKEGGQESRSSHH